MSEQGIAERLRAEAKRDDPADASVTARHARHLCGEAADELDRLKACERQALEFGLRQFYNPVWGSIDLDAWYAAYLAQSERKDQ
jgi:hypothetical protein